MELHDEVRDGLRVFSVSAPRETMRATLFFRVGQADETLATSGWTHLLEHSALHGWSDPRLAFNAAVGLYETGFDVDGEPEAVLEHLLKLTRWLAEPDLSGIGHEATAQRMAGIGPARPGFGPAHGSRSRRCGPARGRSPACWSSPGARRRSPRAPARTGTGASAAARQSSV